MQQASGEALVDISYVGGLPTLIETVGPVSGTVGYAYDSAFRRSQETAGGIAVDVTFDADGLPIVVGDQTVVRDPVTGLVNSRTVGDVTVSYDYDAYAQLLRTRATESTSGPAVEVFDEQITRDGLGRVTTRVETVAGGSPITWTYTYDTSGRLASASDGGIPRPYGYDASDNLTAGPRGSGLFDERDRVSEVGSLVFEHDPAGDLESITDGTAVTEFDIDATQLLQGVTTPAGVEITYEYDGLDRRVGREVDGVDDRGWIYGLGPSPLVELDAAGAVATRFVFGTQLMIPDYLVVGGVNHMVVSDWRGSPRLVIDATDGTVVQRIDYDELGAVTADTNPRFQPFGFQGGLVEPDTGLVRFGARDYDPTIGRFVSRDPILFAGGQTNLYLFAGGDPINYADVTGLGPKTYGIGIDLSGTAGAFSTGLNVSLAVDTDGTFGLLVTPSAGGGTGLSGKAALSLSRGNGTFSQQAGPSTTVAATGGSGLGGSVSQSFNADGPSGNAISIGLAAGGSVSASAGVTTAFAFN